MPNLNPNSTSYVHSYEPNTSDLTMAMDYNNDGEPVLRVSIGGESITITGDVTIPGTIEISNDEGNPLPTHTHLFDENDDEYTASNPLTVDGTVELGATSLLALENINATVTGTVTANVNGTVSVSNFPATQTVDGTVNIGNEVAINDGDNSITVDGTVGITGDVNVTQGTTPWTVSGTVTVQETGFNSTGNISGSSDAFGRLRVSQPFTLFDSAMRYSDDPFKWDQQDTGGATSTHLPNESSVLMSVSGNGDESIRETKRVFAYQPGKGLLVLSTFVMAAAQTGLRQRVGYFGAQNGIYFEQDGEEIYMVIRKYTSGSVDSTSERIPQSSWNTDTMDGNGASGVTLDITKAQIWWCDIEWLGVGSVRTGFVINGQFVVCHIFHHANMFDKVYMTTATLPCRYEITSTGASASMRAICTSVMSEGGYTNRSISRTASTALAGKALSQTVYRPLVCIRLKSTRLDSVVVPTKYDVLGLQQAAFKYAIILNPTLTGASWTSAGSDSNVEYDIAATALTGGTIIDSGVFVGSTKGGSASISASIVDFSQQLGRTIAGVSDIFCLAAIATSNNDDAVGSLTWQEHR